MFKEPINISPDLAEFIGILLGDGGIYKYKGRTAQIEINSGPEDLLYMENHVKPLINKIFGISVRVKGRSRQNEFRIVIYSNKLFKILTEHFGLWNGRKDNVGIPDIIKNSNEKNIAAFIRGLGDTDFSFMFKKEGKYPVIRADLKSKQLVLDLKNILTKMGFSCSVELDKKRRYKTTNWIINTITLGGKKNLAMWIKTIGIANPKHSTKIKLWQTKGKVVPFSTLQTRIDLLKNNAPGGI